MDTSKSYFIERANRYGVLVVRERNPKEDLTGWGALEFILNNGEIFVLSGYPFGQGEEQEGLWVDMNVLGEKEFSELKSKVGREWTFPIDQQESAVNYWHDSLKRTR